MKSTQISTIDQLLDSGAICNELAIAAGILAKRGRQGVIDTRPKILAMLKARDEATRGDTACVKLYRD